MTIRCAMIAVLPAIAVVAIEAAELKPAVGESASVSTNEPKDLRVFFIGNSLTDGVRLERGLRILVESRGHSLNGAMKKGEFARLIAGAPLWWHWYEKNKGDGKPYSAVYRPLLTENCWDALCLQPYTGPLYGMHYKRRPQREQGDVAMCSNFIDLAVKHGVSPNLQVYLYSHWPRLDGYEKKTKDGPVSEEDRAKALAEFDFKTLWDAPYRERGADANGPRFRSVEETGQRRCRAYFERLLAILSEKYAGVLKRPICLIPAGDVMYELNQRLRSDPQKGANGIVYSDIKQFYGDRTHLRPGVGRYIMAMTFYATLYKESPVGLPIEPYNDRSTYYPLFHPDFQEITPNMQTLIQRTTWDVVQSHAYSGVEKAN